MSATDARPQATVGRQDRRAIAHLPRAGRDPADGDPAPVAGIPTLVEHELRRFPLTVVGRWAVALALTTVVAWWAAIGVLWIAAETFGLAAHVESLARDLGFEGFRLASGPVLLAVGLLGAAWVIAVALIMILAAAAYNLYATLLGGISVEAVERVVSHTTATDPATSEPVAVPID